MTSPLLDTFDRADSSSSIGTASDGGTWTAGGTSGSGVFGITSNKAYIVSKAAYPAIVWRVRDLSTVNCDVQVTDARGTTNQDSHALFAFDPTTQTGYRLYWDSSAMNIQRASSSGSWVTVSSPTPTTWTGSSAVLRITYDSATGTVKVYQNGSLLTTYVDGSPLTAGSYVGFSSSGTNGTTSETWDDFSAYTLGTRPGPPPRTFPVFARSRAVTRASVI